MKSKILKTKILLSGLLVALAAPVRAGTNDLTAALQRGLFEEEANHNLPAAIQAYQSVIAQFDKDRKLAATAVFRLGECYRKQGSTNEAAAQYERIVREFADQPPLVELSRLRLPAQAAFAAGQPVSLTATPPAATSAELEEVARIQEMVRNSPDLINAPERGGATTGATPLVNAAVQGHLMVVQYLLKSGADVNLKSDPRAETALGGAAGQGHLAIVELLLKHGAAVDAADPSGDSPLHRAAGAGFKSVVDALLAAKADVNARNERGWTPLHLAAAHGFKSVAEVLLAAKADVNARNKRGDTPLHLAAAAGQSAMVELLLAHKAEVNIKNTGPTDAGNASDAPNSPARTSGATPLVTAILGNHLAVVKLLLAAKAEVNFECEIVRFGRQGQEWGSPLHFAVDVNSPEIAALLLDHGANPNAQVSASGGAAVGSTPLQVAVSRGNEEIAQLLLARKADPNLPDAEGNTPLLRAVFGNKELVKLLLANHAEVNRPDQSGRTPLSYAVGLLETNIAAALLDAKADPNLKDNQGQTPLFYAAQGHKQMVELLLAKGANPNIRDHSGNTPLALAKNIRPGSPFPGAPGVPRPGASPPGRPQPTQGDIAELLRKHGAIEELPRTDVIEIRRPSANFSEVVFTKGTNDYNHFTIFELIAAHYGFVTARPAIAQGPSYVNFTGTWTRQRSLAFPDLRSVSIRRPTEDGLNWNLIRFNLSDALKNPEDHYRGEQLRWGDVVEIPETDHPISAVWQGLPEELVANLKRYLDRQVQLTVKGQTTNLLLSLLTTHPLGTTVDAPVYNGRSAIPPSFALLPVLRSSGLLRASSDLSRVKVKRRDAATGQVYELVLDCSTVSGEGPGFWLRNGDAIEVPEKP